MIFDNDARIQSPEARVSTDYNQRLISCRLRNRISDVKESVRGQRFYTCFGIPSVPNVMLMVTP